MNEKLRSDLWKQYGPLIEVAEETVNRLGEERAWQFVELANDWMDIHYRGILPAYTPEELLASLVYHDFTGLFKEICWSQLLFLSGNYPLLYRNLRFVWELLFRAYHADTYAAANPHALDHPGPSAGEKSDWLAHRERRLNWDTVFQPILAALLPAADHSAIENHYHPLWKHLCSCVHPSSALRLRMIDESALHVLDNFDEHWAAESLQVSAEVFDLIWLAVLSRFPKCVPLLTHLRTFLACPRTRAVVAQGLAC